MSQLVQTHVWPQASYIHLTALYLFSLQMLIGVEGNYIGIFSPDFMPQIIPPEASSIFKWTRTVFAEINSETTSGPLSKKQNNFFLWNCSWTCSSSSRNAPNACASFVLQSPAVQVHGLCFFCIFYTLGPQSKMSLGRCYAPLVVSTRDKSQRIKFVCVWICIIMQDFAQGCVQFYRLVNLL